MQDIYRQKVKHRGSKAYYYKEQNHIKWAINGLRRFRAVATRFDKCAITYFDSCCLIVGLT